MERKEGLEEKDGRVLRAEWEKPSVNELDINAITLLGPPGGVWDGDGYS